MRAHPSGRNVRLHILSRRLRGALAGRHPRVSTAPVRSSIPSVPLSAGLLAVALLLLLPLTARASSVSVHPSNFGLALDYAAATGEVNDVSISRDATGSYVVEDLGAALAPGAGCVGVDANHARCGGTGVQTVQVRLGDGNDELTIADSAYPQPLGDLPVSADGGAGADTLRGGIGPDSLRGGSGDDPLISGGGGSDSMLGEGGNDTMDGGDGNDNPISGGDGDDTIFGGNGNDVGVNGDRDNDTVDGGPGDDDVRGGPGADSVLGGEGDDRLEIPGQFEPDPTAGDDSLDGGPGDDVLGAGPTAAAAPDSSPSPDADSFRGGDGIDTADFSKRTASLKIDLDGRSDDGESGEHDDVQPDVENVIGGSDDDTLTGSGADNFLDGRNGDDRLSGGPGDDVLDGGANNPGNDTLNGGDGRDTLRGRAGDDELDGDSGDDVLSGSGGTDKLDGDDGNDSLEGGAGGDALDGGPGDDTVNGAEVDLVGADGSDDLAGGPGTDALLGDDGNDKLDGGLGPDRMSGGAGRDTVDYENRSHHVTVTLDGIANDGEANEGDNVLPNVESVLGGTVGDDLFGDGDANRLDGGPGEDLVTGNAGADTLDGGNAPDVVQARDGTEDRVNCGDDGDLAIVDRADTVRDCKWIDRGGRRRLVVARSALVRATPSAYGLRLPDGHRFFDLSNAVKIPIASTIDPEEGVVQLATARNSAGDRQEISVSQGIFSVRQEAGKRPVTELRLAGRLRGCARRATARAPTDAPVRRLYTRVDKRKRARYRVRGRYSIGAATGTAWLTEDRCDGTLTRVDSGVVRVRDRVRNTTVAVHAGQSYLARAP
jgi:Ca2+-binding RTX toxin-like protein